MAGHLQAELYRKSIHVATSAIPLAYHFFLDKSIVLYICLFLAAGFWTADLLRIKFSLVERYFLRIFSNLLREREVQHGITGATLLFTGITLAVWWYPQQAAVPAILFLTLADPAAAVIGRHYGRDRFFNKSIEGALAFYLAAALIVLTLTTYSWWGLVIALVMAGVEFLPVPVDDNLTIPVIGGYLFMVI
ncbi:MAG: hypothetical protein GF313_05655 [Caldithrix sp.]|nr:hypothetical protein [Caldithrix sp.]